MPAKVTKNQFMKNSAFYMLMPLLRNVISFMTLPILTRFLAPSDYGIISLLAFTSSLSGVFFLGLNSAIYRYYFKYRDDVQGLRALLSTNLVFTFLIMLLVCGALSFLFPWLNAVFFHGRIKIVWLLISIVQFWFSYMSLINQNINQNQHHGTTWLRYELLSLSIQVPLSIVLVVTKTFTYEAIIVANFISELVKACALLFAFREHYRIVFRYSFFKEMLAYSWPSIPTAIIGISSTYVDRIAMSRFSGLFQVGILEMSVRLASPVKMAMDGVGGALSPVIIDHLCDGSDAAKKKIADISLKTIFVALLLGLGTVLFSKEIVLLLMTPRYYPVITVAPLYIYTNIFGILGMASYWLIYYDQKTVFWQIPLNILVLVCNISFALILIPRYGLMGAAAAVLMASITVQVVQFYIGLRLTPIPLDIPRIVFLFVLLGGETAALYGLYALNLSMVMEIALKAALLASFVCITYWFRIINFHDFKDFLLAIRQRIAGWQNKFNASNSGNS